VHSAGKIGSSRRELDAWVRTLPQPRMIAMEATILRTFVTTESHPRLRSLLFGKFSGLNVQPKNHINLTRIKMASSTGSA
jgi:hypothetical protein